MPTRSSPVILYERFGPPEVLELRRRPIPEPGPEDLLVEVAAAGVNPIDWKIRKGLFECVFDYRFPIVPGWDVSGTVIAAGSGVSPGLFRPGDAVFAYTRLPLVTDNGTYAAHVALPARLFARAPASVPLALAAAVPLAALTAWQALVDHGGIRAGMTVLVTAAAGGVGSYAVPLARHKGARVIATASPANHAHVRERGADAVIDYRAADCEAQLAACAPEGFDIILDGVGGGLQDRLAELVRPGGIIVTLNDPVAEDILRARGIRHHRLFVEPDPEELARIVALIDSGRLPLPPVESMPLAAAAEAHRRLETGHMRGKIILRP